MSEQTAMTVVQRDGAMAEIWPVGCTQYLTSLDDSPDQQQQLEQAMTHLPGKLSLAAGKVIRVVHWMAHRVERQNVETGEVSYGRRMVLVCEDGSMYRTSSGPAISFIGFCVSRRGMLAFDPPLNLRVTMMPGTKGDWISLTHEVDQPKAKK